MNGMQPSRSSRPSRVYSLRSERSARNLLRGELGQMSIFLALVFQVLFVFFAMVINIGLLVHDKINLQNSVDLGAYYAASKQAEILNEIAHLNYQIRQDYKLLAWRYWVLSTLGRDGQGFQPPPARTLPGVPVNDAPRFYNPEGGGPREEVPVSCLASPMWWEFAMLSAGRPPNENYCWHSYNWTSPSIPAPVAPPTPATAAANIFIALLAQASRQNFTLSCEAASPFSWAFVAAIMADYKYSIAYKKKAIRKLRENLVSENPVDRDGKSIRDGVVQTIKKNLTESNLQSFDAGKVQILNGLSKAECSRGATPGENTLPEILTAPGLYYALLQRRGPACQFDIRFQVQTSEIAAGVTRWDPSGVMRNLVSGEPEISDPMHSSLGFEKNPWCMAYMGVKTNTSPRKPFAPFGKAVNLVARAFAQPFGGRIGPWYSKTWTKGSMTSDEVAPPAAAANPPNTSVPMNPAPGQEKRTDRLTSPRRSPATPSFMYSAYTIPNFSRFPGDPLGLRSQLAQATARGFFKATIPQRPATSPADFSDGRIRLNWFYGYGSVQATGDTLAFDNPAATSQGQIPPLVLNYRQLEMAAVAPDLFDITYYSIDPEANLNYVENVRRNPAHYGLSDAPVGDLGSRQNVNEFKKNNVQTQVAAVTTGGVDPSLLQQIYWIVVDWRHLLTSWAPHRAANFSFPTDRFGKCDSPALQTAMIPGGCAAGGRSGYSVRLISREHLNGPWQIGGEGVGADTILNPPGDDSQF